MLACAFASSVGLPAGANVLAGNTPAASKVAKRQPMLKPDVSFFDEMPGKDVGPNGLPSDLTECMNLMKVSPVAYKSAAREMGVEKEVAFDTHERVTLHRQALARHLKKQTSSKLTQDMVYFVVPRAEQSAALHVNFDTRDFNRLLTTGAFVGGDVMWDKAHPALGANSTMLATLGPKPMAAANEIEKGKAFQWTVARNPLDHFMAGVHHVEKVYGKSGKAYELVESGGNNGSTWMRNYAGDMGAVERARAC
jgi:hypothetical protein